MNTNYFTYLLVFAMMLWGGGWSALKILTLTQPMDVVIFWRFFFMSLSFLPILYFLNKPIFITQRNLKYIFASSVLNILFMVFSYLGIQSAFAGAGSVIITTLSPVITFLLVMVLFKTKLQNHQYIGLGLGLVGGFVMLELHDIGLFLESSNIYFLLAALTWAGVTLLAQHSQKHIDPIHYSFAISVIATISSFFYVYESDFLAIFDESLSFWISLLYLSVLGQSVATTIFFIASGKLGSEVTSSYMFLVPIFALLIAWIVLDEEVQTHIIVGGMISIIAVLFINKKKVKG